jgi:hypothetical protein
MAIIVKHYIPFTEQFSVSTYPISVMVRSKLISHNEVAMWFLEPSNFDFANIEDDAARDNALIPILWDFRVIRAGDEFYLLHPDVSYLFIGPLECYDDSELFLYRTLFNTNIEGLARQ